MNNLEIIKPFPQEKYELIKFIKDEKFKQVSLNIHKKKSLCFIIKVITESYFSSKEEILNEINIGKKLRHENFARTIKNYYDHGTHYLLIEYIDQGILLKNFLIMNEIFKIQIDHFKKIVTQLFNSIVYSLNLNICPVDIHPENILIDFNHKVTFIDYGLYKENKHIKFFHFTYLECILRKNVTDLLAITQNSYQSDFFEAWKEKLWSGSNFTKESITKHYLELLNDPFLKQS